MKSAGFHMKSTRFHEIQRISKDQLPGMVTPMFKYLSVSGEAG